MNIESCKKVCVVGLGKSGFSLCNLLLSLKKEARVTEIRERKSFPHLLIDKLREKGVAFEFGGHSDSFIKDCELMILSPGVDPLTSESVKIAHKFNIPCVGEVEFSFWLTRAKFIAITGTNGKTTTTFLTYRVLKKKRKGVFLGGNIGIPVSSFILNTKKNDLIVIEISSFQLETIIEFRPYVACLLNIDPNHLDRHPTFRDYFEAKMNIFRNQKDSDWAVVNQNVSLRKDIEKRVKAKIVYFSSEFPNENLSCVYRTAGLFGISKTDCLKVFSSFRGLPHRLQFVKEKNGVTFINDSKSTNPASTIWALKNIKGNVILIAGGKDKGVDYANIKPYLKRVKKINLIGQASDKIKETLYSHVPIGIFSSLKEVVTASFNEAGSGDTVLFSPMCSSFDMFSNYMERGRKFMEVVNNLDGSNQ
jgi:UDP-N-acetylmuramoylalanine--D-glutamate ligase